MCGADPLEKYDQEHYRKYTQKAEIDKALHELEGILIGIGIDGIINSKEVTDLKNWLEIYQYFINNELMNELIVMVQNTLSDGIIEENEKEDILWLCNSFKTKNIYFDVITSDIQRLEGILHGILSDGDITDIEIIELKKWLEDNEHLAGKYPYDEIYSLLVSILSDGLIDENERKTIKLFISDFVNLDNSCNLSYEEIEELRKEIHINGICALCPEISIFGKTFCFTGTSSKTNRKQIDGIITSLGGFYHDHVTKNTDYLVIGNEGNKCWAFSCYGRKVEQAVNLRKSAHKIMIVHENDFWDTIADIK